MKKLFVVFVLLCATASCYADTTAVPAPPPPPPPGQIRSTTTFDAEIADFKNELSSAKTNNAKAIILFQMGNTYAIQKKNADARTCYDKVLAMDQINPAIKAATWMIYAENYFEQGK